MARLFVCALLLTPSLARAADTARCPRAIEDDTRHAFAAAQVLFGEWGHGGRPAGGALSPVRGIWDMEIQWALADHTRVYAYLACDFENSRMQVLLEIPERTAYCDMALGYCRDAPTREPGERIRCPDSIREREGERKFARSEVQVSPYDGDERPISPSVTDNGIKLWDIAKLAGVGPKDGLFLGCAYVNTPKIVKLRLPGAPLSCAEPGVCR